MAGGTFFSSAQRERTERRRSTACGTPSSSAVRSPSSSRRSPGTFSRVARCVQLKRCAGRAPASRRASLAERLPVPPTNDEVSRLGETLNEMLERIAAGLARERRLVAHARHELRTPLALL